MVQMRILAFIMLCICVIVLGCVKDKHKGIAQFVMGKSKIEDVVLLLGQPDQIYRTNYFNSDLLVYRYFLEPRRRNVTVGEKGFEMNGSVIEQVEDFTFDKSGVLSDRMTTMKTRMHKRNDSKYGVE